MSLFSRAALLVVVAVCALAAYRWWTAPERQIRQVLDRIEEGFSHDITAQGLGAVSAAAALQPYFAADATIEPGPPLPAIQGRDAVMSAAARLHTGTPALRVEFVDERIELADHRQSATVGCTVMATLRDGSGQETVDAREVVIVLSLVNGAWVIASARSIDVLQPVTP